MGMSRTVVYATSRRHMMPGIGPRVGRNCCSRVSQASILRSTHGGVGSRRTARGSSGSDSRAVASIRSCRRGSHSRYAVARRRAPGRSCRLASCALMAAHSQAPFPSAQDARGPEEHEVLSTEFGPALEVTRPSAVASSAGISLVPRPDQVRRHDPLVRVGTASARKARCGSRDVPAREYQDRVWRRSIRDRA
jgi:hypothetical protein